MPPAATISCILLTEWGAARNAYVAPVHRDERVGRSAAGSATIEGRDRRAADDQLAPVAEMLHQAHGVGNTLFAFIGLVPVTIGGWLAGTSRRPHRDDQRLAFEDFAAIGGNGESGMLGRTDDFKSLATIFIKVKRRVRKDGFASSNLVDEPAPVIIGKARNVVDRLFRIEFGALPPTLGVCRSDARDIEKAEFENGEWPDRPGRR